MAFVGHSKREGSTYQGDKDRTFQTRKPVREERHDERFKIEGLQEGQNRSIRRIDPALLPQTYTCPRLQFELSIGVVGYLYVTAYPGLLIIFNIQD
jgi:hypothetical protein